MRDILTDTGFEVLVKRELAFTGVCIIIFGGILVQRNFPLSILIGGFCIVFLFQTTIYSLLGALFGTVSAFTLLYTITESSQRKITFRTTLLPDSTSFHQSHIIIHSMLIPALTVWILPVYVSETSYPAGIPLFFLSWIAIRILLYDMYVQHRNQPEFIAEKVCNVLTENVWSVFITVLLSCQLVLDGDDKALLGVPFLACGVSYAYVSVHKEYLRSDLHYNRYTLTS